VKLSKLFAVLVVASVFTIPSLVVAVDWPTEFDLLTPKDAADIERYDFSDDGKLQLNFSVKRSYPKFALDREQYVKLQKNGWTECETKRNEWFHFFDASDHAMPDKRCRYSFSKNFIKRFPFTFNNPTPVFKTRGNKKLPCGPRKQRNRRNCSASKI